LDGPDDGHSEPGKGPAGDSLIRTGEEAKLLRQRLERPARIGRYVLIMIGAITLGAGAADFVVTRLPTGIAVAIFGAVLLALGFVQHVLYRRDLQHWPTDVLMWDEGLELVLPNGEIRGVTWSDKDLAIQLISRRAPLPAEREYLLLWTSDSKIPAVEVSAEGFDRIAKTAADAGLKVTLTRKGHRVKGTQMVLIRQRREVSTKVVTRKSEIRT
jgi:hypothetical protein